MAFNDITYCQCHARIELCRAGRAGGLGLVKKKEKKEN